MTTQGGDPLAFLDNDLCTDGYPTVGPDFGLLCNEPVSHDGDHRALAEIWTTGRRFVVWTADGVPLPDVEERR
ncbi:hypothetical protein [Streptomyces kaempferi]|uniref:Uncharacterized protein n=1 Tax=Streptomyces kaempferi TaxID=333725 RepID=A0ABW3XKI0_9ACTN